MELEVVKRFRVRVEQWETRQVQLWYDRLVYELDVWYDEVQEAVSVPLPDPPNALTKDRARLFPYFRGKRLNTLKDSFSPASMYAHTTKKGNKSISAKVSVDENGALATNYGFNKPKDAPPGAWIGWFDDVFSGKGRGSVEKSVKEIFNELAKLRAEF